MTRLNADGTADADPEAAHVASNGTAVNVDADSEATTAAQKKEVAEGKAQTGVDAGEQKGVMGLGEAAQDAAPL